GLHKIKAERNGQDRDDDHEPLAMLSKQRHHSIKSPFRSWGALNLRFVSRTPNVLSQRAKFPRLAQKSQRGLAECNRALVYPPGELRRRFGSTMRPPAAH